jgi:flagellar basal body-associated protein FliL
MSGTPEMQDQERVRRRRWIIVGLVAVVLVIVFIAAIAAAWLFFFGSEAPDAPTIDEAIKVLLPSASPE